MAIKTFFRCSLLVTSLLISYCYGATGTINIGTRYQEIEGFGAAGAWYENWLTSNSQREALYDLFFDPDELGIDIYRVRNAYDQDGGADYMSRSGTIVSEALERNPNLKILISSWSPPASLKSNGDTAGGGDATLAGGPSSYVYSQFADWWADSITAWSGYGVDADYISIQNEPDYDASWDSCRFDPTQNSSVAGYDQAFEAVYGEVYSRMGAGMPKMLAPECIGLGYGSLDNFLNAIINHSHVYGYAHHLYHGGGNGQNPDGYIPAMQDLNASWGSKPLFQTEYEDTTGSWPDAYNLALLLHNSLVEEEVSGYLYWDLFWGGSGGLVTLPSYGSSSYTINSDFYGFKHFSGFIHSGWDRIYASEDSSSLRMSAYISPDNSKITVVIINTSTSSSVNLDLSFTGFTIGSGNVYRTTSSQNCALIGTYNGTGTLSIPAYSVTTLSLTGSTGPPRTLSTSSTTGGSVTTPGEGSYDYPNGTNANIVATASTNYDFTNWTGSAVTAGKVASPTSASTTVLMDADYTVVANFVLEQRTLTCSSTTGGSVTTPGEGDFDYDYGTGASIVATPSSNYHFVEWTGSAVTAGKVASPTSASTTVTMDGDYTVVANFAADKRELTILSTAGGSIIFPGEGVFEYDYGAQELVVGEADLNYHFVEWTGTAVTAGKVDDPYSIAAVVTIDANYTIIANFVPDAPQKMLTISSTAGGSVTTPGEGDFSYNEDSYADIVATASSNYHFVEWTGTAVTAGKVASPTSANTTVLMDDDYTVVANFAIDQRTLTCSSTTGGSVTTPGEGDYDYDHGTGASIVATASSNYHFVNWTGTAVTAGKVASPTSENTTVTMDGDYTVVANFTLDQRTLTSSSTTGGSVTTPGEGDYYYDHGTTPTIVATADTDYHFDIWTGTAVTAGKVADPCAASTTVLMDADYTVVANFEADPPDLDPPSPSTMTWATVPAATGSSSITMTATIATDDTPPVEYYFECTTDSDANSTWQTDPNYTAIGLLPNTQYTFRTKARDSSPAQNETAWSSPASATTDPPSPDIEILGDWATDLSHTEEVGYSRALIFIAHEESTSGNPTLTSVTYGGQEMDKIIEDDAVSTYGNYVAAFILDEAGITAATSSTFVPTWSASTSSVSYASVFLGSVDQADPVGDSDSVGSASSPPNPIETGALATEDGDMVILGVTCGNNGSYTLNNGFTEGADQSVGSNGHTGAAGHKLATGVSETPSATFDSSVNRQVIVGFVIQAMAGTVDDPPAAPTNLVATAGNDLVSLDWDDNNETDLAGYNVLRSMTQGSGYGQINVSLVVNSDYVDNNVDNGTPYYYVVTAVDDANNQSGYSNEDSATPEYQDCTDVQNGGHGLVSDINGDCYVNSLDIEKIAYYWLYTNCAGFGDCEDADLEPDGDVDLIDFSDFAVDWLECNHPQDSNCTPNW